MATANEILVGRFNRLLTRLFGTKVPATIVPQIAPEIQPSIELGAMPPELRFLAGENLFIGGGRAATAAATVPYVQLANPAGSGALVIVERALIGTGTTTAGIISMRIWSTIATSAAVANQMPRDARFGTTAGRSVTQLRQGGDRGTDCPTPGTIVLEFVRAAQQYEWIDPLELILPPGTAVTFGNESSAATNEVAAFLWWRERFLEPSEA